MISLLTYLLTYLLHGCFSCFLNCMNDTKLRKVPQILNIAHLCGISVHPLCALRLLHNKSYSNYNSIVSKAERSTLEVNHLWRLAIKVFKTLKLLNLDFIHTCFKKGSHSAQRKNDLIVNRAKTATFGILYLKTAQTFFGLRFDLFQPCSQHIFLL